MTRHERWTRLGDWWDTAGDWLLIAALFALGAVVLPLLVLAIIQWTFGAPS